jgi:hypothetical protein
MPRMVTPAATARESFLGTRALHSFTRGHHESHRATACIALPFVAVSTASLRAKPRPIMPDNAVYVARLLPINRKASGMSAEGEMRFTVHGDSLTIAVRVGGVPANIEHWQHFHGFPDGHQANCATIAADTSRDGYIDIRETEPVMGTTMVPFNADPVGMDIPTHDYPHADAKGNYVYDKTVSLVALQRAFGMKYGGEIDLTKRVAQVHGVPESVALPKRVASLGTLSSRITIPLACGAIKRIK